VVGPGNGDCGHSREGKDLESGSFWVKFFAKNVGTCGQSRMCDGDRVRCSVDGHRSTEYTCVYIMIKNFQEKNRFTFFTVELGYLFYFCGLMLAPILRS
jgi:hypothetical protein